MAVYLVRVMARPRYGFTHEVVRDGCTEAVAWLATPELARQYAVVMNERDAAIEAALAEVLGPVTP